MPLSLGDWYELKLSGYQVDKYLSIPILNLVVLVAVFLVRTCQEG